MNYFPDTFDSFGGGERSCLGGTFAQHHKLGLKESNVHSPGVSAGYVSMTTLWSCIQGGNM